jgi:hypothetical protein
VHFTPLPPAAGAGVNSIFTREHTRTGLVHFPKRSFRGKWIYPKGDWFHLSARGLGYSDWLFSLSLSSSLPGRAGWIPVRPFTTLLLSELSPVANPGSFVFYEAGFKAGIWGLFEIYFPLLVSENIGSIHGSMKERIRFVLTLNSFNRLDFIGIMD